MGANAYQTFIELDLKLMAKNDPTPDMTMLGSSGLDLKLMAKNDPTPDMTMLGSSGLNHYRGVIEEELQYKLRGTQGMKIFREMSDNDPIVGGILWVIESLFKQAKWRVERADSSEDGIAAAQFVKECMFDMSHSWEDLLSEILTMLVYGWSYFEIVYKRRVGPAETDPSSRSRYDDNRVGWRKIVLRPQETLVNWDIEDDGGVRGLWQNAPPYYQTLYIPIEKALLFRVRSNKGNPLGRNGGILRNAHRSWYFTKRLQELEATGAERDLAGYPVMQVPVEILSRDAGGEAAAIRTLLEGLIQGIKRDEREGALIPSELDRNGMPTGYKLSLMSAGGNRNFNTGDIIKRYETRIAQSVLAEFMMLGTEGVGSFALSSSKAKMFAIALGALRDNILGTFNRFAIPRLCEFNGIPSEFYPELKCGDFETPPLDELGGFISQLASVGMIHSDPKLENHLRDMAKLPILEEDEMAMAAEQQAAKDIPTPNRNGGRAA